MLLRGSITTTKKFFQKTLKNFKSLFSSEYQKLPKSTSPHIHLSNFAATNHVMDIDMDMGMNIISNNNGSYVKLSNASPYKEKNQVKKREVHENKNIEKRLTLQRGKKNDSSLISNDMKEKRYLVEEKLKELEMLDINNVDYVMDIEEVLHYYSRLTCPVYVEIVYRFFMEMYSDQCERF